MAGAINIGTPSLFDWVNADPTSGQGNGSTTWTTTQENSGRDSRSVVAYFRSGSLQRRATINQLGRPVFIELITPTGSATSGNPSVIEYYTSPDGESMTIEGYTNAKRITYTKDVPINDVPINLEHSISPTYSANGVTTSNDALITGDPGTLRKFKILINWTSEENLTPNNRFGTIQIVGYGNNNETCTITIAIHQVVADPFLWLGKEDIDTANITLEWPANSRGYLEILSNTNWYITNANGGSGNTRV